MKKKQKKNGGGARGTSGLWLTLTPYPPFSFPFDYHHSFAKRVCKFSLFFFFGIAKLESSLTTIDIKRALINPLTDLKVFVI